MHGVAEVPLKPRFDHRLHRLHEIEPELQADLVGEDVHQFTCSKELTTYMVDSLFGFLFVVT